MKSHIEIFQLFSHSRIDTDNASKLVSSEVMPFSDVDYLQSSYTIFHWRGRPLPNLIAYFPQSVRQCKVKKRLQSNPRWQIIWPANLRENVISKDGKELLAYGFLAVMSKKQKHVTGYTNLLSHIEVQHKDQLEDNLSATVSNKSSIGIPRFWSDKHRRIHKWMQMTIECLQLFFTWKKRIY